LDAIACEGINVCTTIDNLREARVKDGDTVSMYDFEFDFVS
jgi:hypothetical protein